MFVVGFTGTRNGPTPAQHNTMRWLLGGLPISRFVHGGSKGCCTIAHWIVRRAFGDAPIDIYPSPRDSGSVIWGAESLATSIHPDSATEERNRVIVSRIHGLIAVPATDKEELRSGTWATVQYAREAGVPVYVIQQNGRVVRG